ncbi:MAG: 2-oxo acid dehydrogenase subunit E2 [Anaerolineae bacterium]|nr:2-oxo acid dehydrogenase subunit E2 [Anaerolineae bacterium]
MATKIFLPRLGESIEEAIIERWVKKVGDPVALGDVIAELETAKATMELESPAKGILLAVIPQVGQTIQLGDLVAIVGNEGENWQGEVEPTGAGLPNNATQPPAVEAQIEEPIRGKNLASSEAKRVNISPNARRIAQELGVDWTGIPLPEGVRRITSEMIQDFARKNGMQGKNEMAGVVIPLTKIQSITARRMLQSAQTIPQFSVSMDMPAGRLLDVAKEQKTKSGSKVTVTAVLVKKIAEALSQHKRMNARYDAEKDAIFAFDTINIAVATATPMGLFVPVIHDANALSLAEIGERLAGLVDAAKAGGLKLEDATGATFTVSNLGMMQVTSFTPIIDPGQSAIMGVGNIREVVERDADGNFAPRMVINLTVTADHRVLDGMAVAEFLATLRNLLENM